MNLKNRYVLVTGASSGIGEATARAFAAKGASVILLSEKASDLKSVEESILATGAFAVSSVVDLTKSDQIDGLIERLEQEVGPIDIVVNNAGVGLGAVITETDMKDLRFVFEINFFALHSLCRQAVRCMASRRQGHIINVTSAAGRFGSPKVAAYSASKGAAHAYTQALRIEASIYNIYVSECIPISVKTRFFDEVRGKAYRPQGIVLTAEHVADTIVGCAASQNPPPEVLPYRPIRAIFVLEALFPGIMTRIMQRRYKREMEK